MNEVKLCGVIEHTPQIQQTPGKIPLVCFQLRITETLMLGNGSAHNVSSYFPVRCLGKKYLEALKQMAPSTELSVKGRLARQSYISKEGVHNDDTYVVVTDEYGVIEQLNTLIKTKK